MTKDKDNDKLPIEFRPIKAALDNFKGDRDTLAAFLGADLEILEQRKSEPVTTWEILRPFGHTLSRLADYRRLTKGSEIQKPSK